MCGLVNGPETSTVDGVKTSLFNGRFFLKHSIEIVEGIWRHVESVHDVSNQIVTDTTSERSLPQYSVERFREVNKEYASGVSPGCSRAQECPRLMKSKLYRDAPPAACLLPVEECFIYVSGVLTNRPVNCLAEVIGDQQ